MSENQMDASNQGASGSGGQPNPGESGSSGAESSATGQEALATILSQLDEMKALVSEKRISDLVDARVKSDKDVRFDRVEAEVDNLRGLIEKSGGDYDVVATDIKIQGLERQIADLAPGSPSPAGTVEDPAWLAAQGKVDAALQGAGISEEDPAYKSLVDRYRDKVQPADFVEIVGTFIQTRQRGATPGAVIPEGDFEPPDTDATNALRKEYNERLAQIAQGDHRALSNLKSEYRRKGLDIW
jgi:hypothetical protein